MSVIDGYLTNNATAAQRTELERVRRIAKQAAPEAEEVISYGYVDDLIALDIPTVYLGAVGAYREEFDQVGDQEIEILDAIRK